MGGQRSTNPDAGGSTAPAGAPAISHDADASEPEEVAIVRVGVRPTPLWSEDVGFEAHARAQLEVLAAGSRGVSLIRRWDDLTNAAGTPADTAWTPLELAAELSRGQTQLLLSLSIVEGAQDTRPESLSGPWDGAGTRAAVEQLIDRALTSLEGSLAYLTFGANIDRHLEVSSDKTSFVAFLIHAIEYARAHGKLGAATRVGIATSWRGLLDPTDELRELLGAGNLVAVTYLPMDAEDQVRPARHVADDLDAMLAAFDDAPPNWLIADQPSIVLQQVGYPSSETVGSSLASQRDFYDLFFQALHARRAQFPFVVVDGLHEAAPERCVEYATAWGSSDDAAAAYCSLGLRDTSGVAKPAFDRVLRAVASFSTP